MVHNQPFDGGGLEPAPDLIRGWGWTHKNPWGSRREIAKEINMNSGIGFLGHGWRANNTIGRAVRLCLINLGHTWPAVNDMALDGRASSHTLYTFAENEEYR